MIGSVSGVWSRVWRSTDWRRRACGALLGVAAVTAAVVAGEGQRPARDLERRPAVGGGVVAGRVRMRTGQLLRDAVVTLERRDGVGRARSTVTDGRGRYRFDHVPMGRYQVSAIKAGFGRRYHGEGRYGEPVAPIDVGPGHSADDVDVVLPRGAVLAGRLQDDAGLPVPRANVFAVRRVTNRGVVSLRVAGADVTDDRGAYRVFDLEPGRYYLRAVAMPHAVVTVGAEDWRAESDSSAGAGTGYAPSYYPGVTRLGQARPVGVRESQEVAGIDFALLRVALATVTGTVVAPAGANAAGTDVRLMPADGPELPGGVLSDSAAPGGGFAFDRVPPGRYVLRARGRTAAGGAAFGRQVVDVDGASLEGLSVVLTQGAAVGGAVRFDGTAPTWRDIVDLQVTTSLLEAEPGSGEVRTAVAAGDWTFRLDGLPPGPRRFGITGLGETRVLDRITLNGRDIGDRAVTLGGGVRVAGLEIVVSDRVSELRGVVRGGGDEQTAGAVVVAFSTDPERWFSTSRYVVAERSAHDGRYRLRGVPPDDYWVTAVSLSVVGADDWLAPRSLDRLRTGATRVSVRKGDTVDVDVQVRRR